MLSLNHRRHEDFPLPEERYTVKPRKPWSWTRPLHCLFQEQRLLFVLVGIVLTSAFFIIQPDFGIHSFHSASHSTSWSSSLTDDDVSEQDVAFENNDMHRKAYEVPYGMQQMGTNSPGAKVPLGLKQKSLRTVVTGGAGFVGSHLVDKLMARGDSVIVVDNLFTGGRKENVQHHLGNPKFELIRHDVVEPLMLEVDQIYHLACPASPVHYKFNPVKTIKTNVVGTLNMLGLAKRVGARFLLTSTSEVYGDPLEHPQKEEYWANVNPIGVRSCYDEAKRTAETLVTGVQMCSEGAPREAVRIARIFNTYGPRMCIDDGRVVSNFVAQALRKEPMTVYGDGKQTRSFQYVSDLVEGLIRLMEGEHVGSFNLGNPGEITMLELAEVVKDVIDPSAKIEFRVNTADDPHRRKLVISKARELLGWELKISLKKGLPHTVADFRKRIFDDHITQLEESDAD